MSKVTKFKVGDTIEWTSQAGGFTKTKTGQVKAILAPNDNVKVWLHANGINEFNVTLHGNWNSIVYRYLVETTKKRNRQFFTPIMDVVDKTGKLTIVDATVEPSGASADP
jgi:hypothetical protein